MSRVSTNGVGDSRGVSPINWRTVIFSRGSDAIKYLSTEITSRFQSIVISAAPRYVSSAILFVYGERCLQDRLAQSHRWRSCTQRTKSKMDLHVSESSKSEDGLLLKLTFDVWSVREWMNGVTINYGVYFASDVQWTLTEQTGGNSIVVNNPMSMVDTAVIMTDVTNAAAPAIIFEDSEPPTMRSFTATNNNANIRNGYFSANESANGAVRIRVQAENDAAAGRNSYLAYILTMAPGDTTANLFAFAGRFNESPILNLQPAAGATLANPHCFVRGTLLRRADGSDAPVESLKIGEALHTSAGPSPIIKTGSWLCAGTEPAYKIEAGTHGAQRDLFVSKWHRVVLSDGSRLPAHKVLAAAAPEELLVRQESGVLQFFHAQVENGADLLAEGCTVESWNGVM